MLIHMVLYKSLIFHLRWNSLFMTAVTQSPVMSRTGLTGGDGNRLYEYAKNGNSFVNSTTLRAKANALAVSEVNAAMGSIVATPTAG
jgi:L-serine dehydratase